VDDTLVVVQNDKEDTEMESSSEEDCQLTKIGGLSLQRRWAKIFKYKKKARPSTCAYSSF